MSAEAGRRWWAVPLAVVTTGVLAGLAGAALTLLLHLVQHLGYGYTDRTFLAGVSQAPWWRRLVAPAVGGLLAGLAWWGIHTRAAPSVKSMLARREGQDVAAAGGGLRWPLAEACTQILFVGSGGSVGREGAPRLAAAAVGQWLSLRIGLDLGWQRTLIAAASGAGLAAVYNVPLSGVVFVLEVVLARWSVRAALVAAPMCVLATVVAWPVVINEPVFVLPTSGLVGSSSLLGWLFVALGAPLGALVAVPFQAAVRSASRRSRSTARGLPVQLMAAGVLVGVAACWLPGVAGNGKGILQVAFEQPWTTAAAFAAMLAVKPVATVACFRAGATGGMLMPSLSVGAALGSVLGLAVLRLDPGGPVATSALIVAVAVLAGTQQAPLFAAALGWELTHAPAALAPLLLASAVVSHGVCRGVARLVERRGGPPPDGSAAAETGSQ